MNNERKIKDLYHIVDELVNIRDTINFPKQSLRNRFNAVLEDIQKHNNLLNNNKEYWDQLLDIVDNQRQI
jgi:hypothetical protein|tara:strand:+ start:37 stop:246 length:210 start_codon:yes stop_codon:yes gene_type:complete